MKSILTLTDFSQIADHAVEAAFQIAQLYSADLHIYHHLTNDELMKIEFGSTPKFSFNSEGQTNAIETIRFWNEWSQKLEVNTEFIVSSENFLTKTSDLVANIKPDIIIMGSNGAGGKQEYLWGSNTQKVVQSVDCPVLVIKDRVPEYQFDNFIFASTFDEREQESFNYFLKLLQPGKSAHIHFVFIDTMGYFNNPSAAIQESMKKFETLASDYQTTLHFHKDSSVDSGLRSLMDLIEPDMLVMTNKFGNSIKNLFTGSDVNRMINHSTYPVLIIDY